VTGLVLLDRGEPAAPLREAGASVAERPSAADGAPIVCAACGATVTDSRSAIGVDGAHEHTFVNPAGIIYRVRCFATAPGCRESGEPTQQWSWFPAYAWRYGFCASCDAHLGWAYRSARGDGFYGLVADRLAEGRAS
jgi:hypothetical protein